MKIRRSLLPARHRWQSASVLLLLILLAPALSACNHAATAPADEITEGTNDGFAQLGDEEADEVSESGEEPSNAASDSAFEGKWYLDGDLSGEYYELTESGFARYIDGFEYTSGSYAISSPSAGETSILLGDEAFADEGYFSPNLALFHVSGFGDGSVYIHESAIGTSALAEAKLWSDLVNSTWRAMENELQTLSFYRDGRFELITATVNDEASSYRFEITDSGQWTLTGAALALTWSDGRDETCDFTGHTLTAESLGMAFGNGKQPEGALEKWYGSYFSETGSEIDISESIHDNCLEVSFYLNDEIGSMYSSGGIELSADGGSAADAYVMLRIDGDTVTVEALHDQFADYAGTYVREKP
jgi:hypothetical protein